MAFELRLSREKLFDAAFIFVILIAVVIASFGKLMLGAVFGVVFIIILGLTMLLLTPEKD